jgi:dTDP-4-amino-4,6-dideoxygalactose transaminase
MYYLVPPAGTPTTASDIIVMVSRWFLGRGHSGAFAREIQSLTGAGQCYLFDSGRASLAAGLRALAKLSSLEKNEVVIPAYTCFTVAASVVQSGLRVRIVDIDPRTLDYDYEKLIAEDFSRVIAIVGCNLLGIPSDWKTLRTISERQGVFLVDDAAQALGSRTQVGAAGMSGHLGVFSFGRGKNLSTYSGGALVTSDKRIAGKIDELLQTVPGPSAMNDLAALANIVLYSLFLHPRVYWLPAKLPFLGLGKTVYDPSFDIITLGPMQMCAGSVLLRKIDHINSLRARNARKLASALHCTGRFEIPGLHSAAPTIYLRLPLVCANRGTRDNAIARLRRVGISASTMYPSTIRQIPGIEEHLASDRAEYSGAQTVVDRMLVLPTHPLLDDADIDRMISSLVGSK